MTYNIKVLRIWITGIRHGGLGHEVQGSRVRFNVRFVDCTSVFVKSVFETSLSFTYIL